MIAGACGAPQPAMPDAVGRDDRGGEGALDPWHVVELREHLRGDRGEVGAFHVGQDVPVADDRDRAANLRLRGEAREHLAMEPGSMRR